MPSHQVAIAIVAAPVPARRGTRHLRGHPAILRIRLPVCRLDPPPGCRLHRGGDALHRIAGRPLPLGMSAGGAACISRQHLAMAVDEAAGSRGRAGILITVGEHPLPDAPCLSTPTVAEEEVLAMAVRETAGLRKTLARDHVARRAR